MRVALLCPGPSLSLYPGEGFDCLIAVNRAVLAHRADWWSIGDAEAFTFFHPSYTPAIWTHENTALRLTRGSQAERFFRHRCETYERIESLGWPLFSATAALKLAEKLGATSIDCYGCDMAGEADWDGLKLARNRRDESRWKLERRIWDKTVESLRGINVVRATR